MKKLVLYCSALVLILTSLLGCSSKSVELNISAAASLQDAAKELQNLYNQEHPDVKILYNFGASGTPVSYTHLDVYKRQIQYCGNIVIIKLNLCSKSLGFHR